MFLLNGKPLSPDVAFTDINNIQRPANWLRLASVAERAAAGVTEVPDPPNYDQRFFWGPDLPKDHGQLVEQWTATTRATANTLLAPTDWMVVREVDNNTPMDPAVKELRQLYRLQTGEKVTAIKATANTAALASYITGPDYSKWGPEPELEPELIFSHNSTSSGF
jgi:hypothetical protein